MSKREFPWPTVRRQGLMAATGLSEEYTATQKQIADGNAATQKQIADLTIETRVGFSQIDTKLADLRGDLIAQITKIEGDISLLRQSSDFWEFVRRSITSGLVVTVVGGLLLTTWKLLIFGKLS